MWTDSLSFEWNITDDESGVVEHYVSVMTQQSARNNISITKVKISKQRQLIWVIAIIIIITIVFVVDILTVVVVATFNIIYRQDKGFLVH